MRVENIPRELWSDIDFSEFGESEFPSGEIRGIIESGEIVAWYLMERSLTHVGPFWVAENHRGRLGGFLVKDADDQTKGETVYIAATNEQSITLCQKMGLNEIDGKLFAR